MIAAAAVVVAACNSNEPTPNPATATSTTPGPTADTTPTLRPTSTPPLASDANYDSNLQMWSIFTNTEQIDAVTMDALESVIEHGDRSLVPVIIEISRYWGDGFVQLSMAQTLEELTSQTFGGPAASWNEWMIWLGQNAEDYRPPSEYWAWKANLLSLIDPRMGEFFTQNPG